MLFYTTLDTLNLDPRNLGGNFTGGRGSGTDNLGQQIFFGGFLYTCAVEVVLQKMFNMIPSPLVCTRKNQFMYEMKTAYITASFDPWLSFPVGRSLELFTAEDLGT